MFPPIPSWDGLHVLIIHFPIALLLVAPIFVVLGIAVPRYARPYQYSALLLMVLGTIGAFVAVSTGEAARDLADGTEGFREVLERHEQLAEWTRNAFAALTVVWVLLVLVPRLIKRTMSLRLMIALHGVFLVVYFAAMLLLSNTAHLGGGLVHQFEVRAMLPKIKLDGAKSSSGE